MKTIQNYSYRISDDLFMDLKVNSNPYNIDINELFSLAARINKKRSFLFVSKVLGKHIPAKPSSVLNTGKILGRLYADKKYGVEFKFNKKNSNECVSLENLSNDISKVKLPEKNIVLGFAETATALGHSVFEVFKNAEYIHTTREKPELEPVFEFIEEHSHATAHTVFTNDSSFFDNENPIILVDDEITTGKTALNIIEKIHEKYPRKCYSILTILDWRSVEHKERYEHIKKELGIEINVYSLISGSVETRGTADLKKDVISMESGTEYIEINEYYFDNYFQRIHNEYIKYTGRFGMDSDLQNELEETAGQIAEDLKKLNTKKIQENILFLGVGEFMYFPLKIADCFGGNVVYHSTTRSPILARTNDEYAIQNKFRLHNIYNENINEFVYNIPSDYYDSLYIFYERYSSEAEIEKLKEKLKLLGIKKINICFMLSVGERSKH